MTLSYLPWPPWGGITRQVTVLAFAIGDGSSNRLQSSNPRLMIALGFTVGSYPKW